jgi:hypothetical protein
MDQEISLMFAQGLIIGSASAYTVDLNKSDIAKRMIVGSIQSHETGHQW